MPMPGAHVHEVVDRAEDPDAISVSIGVIVAASSMRRAMARKRTTRTMSIPPIVGVPALP
jgi:hypothetical protein